MRTQRSPAPTMRCVSDTRHPYYGAGRAEGCVVRPNSRSYSVAQGKGLTPEAAKA